MPSSIVASVGCRMGAQEGPAVDNAAPATIVDPFLYRWSENSRVRTFCYRAGRCCSSARSWTTTSSTPGCWTTPGPPPPPSRWPPAARLPCSSTSASLHASAASPPCPTRCAACGFDFFLSCLSADPVPLPTCRTSSEAAPSGSGAALLEEVLLLDAQFTGVPCPCPLSPDS